MDQQDKLALFVTIPGIVIVFSLAIYFVHSMDRQSEEKHKKNQQDCQDLDVKYGDKLRAKVGFYRSVDMSAVGMGEETVEVQYLKGLQIDNARFLCGDLEKVK